MEKHWASHALCRWNFFTAEMPQWDASIGCRSTRTDRDTHNRQDFSCAGNHDRLILRAHVRLNHADCADASGPGLPPASRDSAARAGSAYSGSPHALGTVRRPCPHLPWRAVLRGIVTLSASLSDSLLVSRCRFWSATFGNFSIIVSTCPCARAL